MRTTSCGAPPSQQSLGLSSGRVSNKGAAELEDREYDDVAHQRVNAHLTVHEGKVPTTWRSENQE